MATIGPVISDSRPLFTHGFWADHVMSSNSSAHKRSPPDRLAGGIEIVIHGNNEILAATTAHKRVSQQQQQQQQQQERPSSAMSLVPLSPSPGSAMSYKPARSSSLTRSPSMIRSPTITKNIHSLSSLAEAAAHNQACGERKVEYQLQLLMPLLLLATVLVVWCVHSLPPRPLADWLFPEDPPMTPVAFAARSWLEFLAVLALLAGCALLARLAFPHFNFSLRLPAQWNVNFNLSLTLRGLGPAWNRGVNYLIPLRASFGGCSFKGSKVGKGSGIAATWHSGDHHHHHHHRDRSPGGGGGLLSPLRPLHHPSSSSLKATCGVHTYSNGDRYEGEFYQGRCSGRGVYFFALSGRYEGDWADGKYDGYGVETWSRGSRYRGQYRQGLRDGYGVYRFYTGDVYGGLWSKGQSHGVGAQTCADGSRYLGEFAWGAKHGFGKYIFRGRRRQGSGLGGLWNDPVGEARRASMRAADVQRVDERVSKAVAAANRAAVAARAAATRAAQKGSLLSRIDP
eukprot:jgi/Mesen1/7493/ME000039S06709